MVIIRLHNVRENDCKNGAENYTTWKLNFLMDVIISVYRLLYQIKNKLLELKSPRSQQKSTLGFSSFVGFCRHLQDFNNTDRQQEACLFFLMSFFFFFFFFQLVFVCVQGKVCVCWGGRGIKWPYINIILW